MCDFIISNLSYVRNYLSSNLANSLANGDIKEIDDNFLIRFRIFCMILWYKIKIEKSIEDPNISIDEILKN